MTLLTNIQAINEELNNLDFIYNKPDRGQFYIQQYELTGSSAALLEGHISMFSGTAGGNAFAANYLLAEWGEQANASFSYSDNAGGINQIYQLSQNVATGLGAAIFANIDQGDEGNLSISEGITAAQGTWNEYNLNLATYFPGQALIDLGLLGVVPTRYPTVVN